MLTFANIWGLMALPVMVCVIISWVLTIITSSGPEEDRTYIANARKLLTFLYVVITTPLVIHSVQGVLSR